MSAADDAWNQLVADEAKTLVDLLSTDGRKVMVVVMAHKEGSASLFHDASEGCTGADARAFIQCLDLKREQVASRLIRRRG